MKKLFAFLICLLLTASVFCLPALAAQTISLADDDMSLQLPDDFIIVRRDNLSHMEDLLRSYGATVTETDAKLQSGNYRFIAVSNSMRCTLFLTAHEDAVSHTIGDLITYPDQVTAKGLLLGKVLPEGATLRELEHNGALFYRVDFGVQEQIGRIAYFTVINGRSYSLGVVDNSGDLSSNTNALIDTVFDNWEYTIKAEQQRIRSFREQVTSSVYLVCQILAVIALGVVIWLAIRNLRRKQMNADLQKNLPKRPRR